jgi:sodium-dependent dicarboxylate transporter 2/3/5
LTDGRLSPEGLVISGILGAVVVVWASEAIPLPVTALFGAVLCFILGVAPARQVFGYFADPIVFLFIGSFILARAMMVHRLDRRIALTFLSISWLSASPTRILIGLGVVTAVLSMWVSNTATTAMMLPIALGLLGAFRDSSAGKGEGENVGHDLRDWPFATGAMLMVGYAASVGGIGTPVGSPPNLIGIGLLRSSAGVEISFLTWMTLAIPMVLLMGGALFLLLHRLHPAGTTGADPGAMRTYIERERTHLGPLRQGELNTMLAFALAVVLWTLPGTLAILGLGGTPLAGWMVERFPEAVVALVAAILLFLLPVRVRPWEPTLRWSDAVGIDWGTILLFGGGLALGTLMFETGVAGAMGESLTARLGGSTLWGLTFLSIILAVLLSETTSNTAAANMVIPVIIAVAFAAGVNPVPPALGACFGASFGFMLPVSTPPNAIIYGSGLVPIPKMMRAGVIFDLLGIGIIWLGLRIMCPLLGLS